MNEETTFLEMATQTARLAIREVKSRFGLLARAYADEDISLDAFIAATQILNGDLRQAENTLSMARHILERQRNADKASAPFN